MPTLSYIFNGYKLFKNQVFRNYKYFQYRINYIDENLTMNISDMLPANMPDDVDDNLKLQIAREGLELLHNGTGTFFFITLVYF